MTKVIEINSCVIEINSCQECNSYQKATGSRWFDLCAKTGQILPRGWVYETHYLRPDVNIFTPIPDWCPLPKKEW